MACKYKFKRILKTLSHDVKEGFIYLCEALDDSGDVVDVRMSEKYLVKEGCIVSTREDYADTNNNK